MTPVPAALVALALLAGAEPPAAVEAPPPAVAPADDAARIAALLERLERAGGDLRDFRCRIALERFDALLEETERRFGRLALAGQGKDRRLAVVFEEFIDGSGRADTSRSHWLIRDGWLFEIDEGRKMLTERQLHRPEESFDPLKLGEGPLPIPFGQPKDEVLRLFAVSEIGPPDRPLLRSVGPTFGLRFVPKPGVRVAKDTTAIDVWYDAELLVPLGIATVAENGNRETIRLSTPVRNGGLPPEDAALLERPKADPTAWSIDRRPLVEPGR